jgi:hypothetical protein
MKLVLGSVASKKDKNKYLYLCLKRDVQRSLFPKSFYITNRLLYKTINAKFVYMDK